MRSIRLLVAVSLLVAAVATLGWAWLHADDPVTSAGDFPVAVVAADGTDVYNGTLHAENATALSVLQAAGAAGGFEVRVRSFGAYGGRSCDGAYVESVAGHAAQGASGWVFRVWTPASGWTSPAESAACVALHPGDRLEWRWTAASAV